MNVLAIDTGNKYLSIALKTQDGIESINVRVNNSHSQHIIPKIQKMLLNFNISIQDINTIIYNEGPGSFTGLRIGLSVALGISYPINCKIYKISRFALYLNQLLIKINNDKLLQQNLQTKLASSDILVILDAKLNEFYIASFNGTSLSCNLFSPQLVSSNDLIKILIDFKKIVPIVIGDIVNISSDTDDSYNLKCIESKELIDIEELILKNYIYLQTPTADNMLNIFTNYPNLMQEVNIYEADLLYLRNKVALTKVEQQELKQKNHNN